MPGLEISIPAVRNQTASDGGHTVSDELFAAHDFSFEASVVDNASAGWGPTDETPCNKLFCEGDPEVVGNDYLIIGTVKKATWREGLQRPKALAEIVPDASDFAEYYEELRVTRPGWYKAGQEPPVMEPPPSRKWVKAKSD